MSKKTDVEVKEVVENLEAVTNIEAKKENYKVWECRIVVPENAEMPMGFDLPPRTAAQNAVYDAGIKVVACFSGWGKSVTDTEREVIEQKC